MELTAILEEKKNQKETKNSKYKKQTLIILTKTTLSILSIITANFMIDVFIKTLRHMSDSIKTFITV